jgi:hypothetical protein
MLRAVFIVLTAGGLLASLASFAACSKDETEPAPESASASASASALAPAPAPAPAPASATAPASAPDPIASAASSHGARTAASTATSVKGAPTCGDKPMPPCPLYAWMKANTSAAMSAQDYDALATALDKTAKLAPPGYTNWVSISKDGAAAARAQSLDGVKGACRGCHNQYKNKYKKEMRDRPI